MTKVISESIVETLAVNAMPMSFAIIKNRDGSSQVNILNPLEAERLRDEINAWLPGAKKSLGVG